MSIDSELKKIIDIVDERYSNIKTITALLAVCPHVVPSGIGVVTYIEELYSAAKRLRKLLLEEVDYDGYLRTLPPS